MAGTTVQKLSYNSSTPVRLDWDTFTTGTNEYINVNGLDGSKVLLIVSRESTAFGTTYYIGTSDSATTRSASAALFSAAGLNRLKIGTTAAVKAKAYTKFRTTATTKLVSFEVLGPFETARFKDSDGYINFTKRITGSTTAKVAAILLP